MGKLASFLLALPVLAATHAQAQPHFSIQAITYGQPGQMLVAPQAINNRGQVTGTLFGSDDFPFFYSGGQVTPIITVAGDSVGLAINNHGQVVGGGDAGQGPFIWPGTTAPFGSLNSFAEDINDSGIVVGGPPAFVYQGSVLTDLGLGPDSVATGINNSGRIVGISNSGAFLWRNGKVTTLPLVAAYAINNAGDVLGSIQKGSGPFRPVLYKHGQIRHIVIPLNTVLVSMTSINERDEVVGVVEDASFTTTTPFLWNGTFYDLNSLIPPHSGWVLREAAGINERGQIVGSGRLNGLDLGYILTPE